jgi:hypothetical protein
MKFLAKRTTWTNTELGLLKICWISLGICLGSLIVPIVEEYLLFFLLAFVIMAMASLTLWVRKMSGNTDR